MRGRGIDGIAQAAEMRACGLEPLDNDQQMADRARQAIEPDHDQGFACPDPRSNRVSTGRLRSAPEACFSSTISHPDARNSSACGPVPCSSVDTRA